MEKDENLGKVATDKITGFTGKITARCEYIFGIDQYLVEAPSDGREVKSVWFVKPRLDIS